MKNIPLSQMDEDLAKKAKQIVEAVNETVPLLVGNMLVDGFKKSFDLQQFDDNGEKKWQEVERRNTGSGWYGFNYRTNGKVPGGSRGYNASGTPKRYGTRGGITNFSPASTTRNILLGNGSTNLRDSIFLKRARAGRVIVGSDQPHAGVHNEGLTARIFGCKSFKMPKRQFMGHSDRHDEKAKHIIDRVVNKVLE